MSIGALAQRGLLWAVSLRLGRWVSYLPCKLMVFGMALVVCSPWDDDAAELDMGSCM